MATTKAPWRKMSTRNGPQRVRASGTLCVDLIESTVEQADDTNSGLRAARAASQLSKCPIDVTRLSTGYGSNTATIWLIRQKIDRAIYSLCLMVISPG